MLRLPGGYHSGREAHPENEMLEISVDMVNTGSEDFPGDRLEYGKQSHQAEYDRGDSVLYPMEQGRLLRGWQFIRHYGV
jgi:hypothetical protein